MASRRSSEELIFQGRVTVNGSVCKTPQVKFIGSIIWSTFFVICVIYVIDIISCNGQTKVNPEKDIIYVNGNRLSKRLPPKVYFALNKPKG